jgi:hypothetical protein
MNNLQPVCRPSPLVVTFISPSGSDLVAIMHKIEDGSRDIDYIRVTLVFDLLINPISACCSSHCAWRLRECYQYMASRLDIYTLTGLFGGGDPT